MKFKYFIRRPRNTMAKETNSVDTPNVLEENTPASSSKEERNITKGASLTAMDKIVSDICNTAKLFAKTSSDADCISKYVNNILRTINEINMLDHTAIGLRVKDYLYRFDEFETYSDFAKLVVPGRIVLSLEDDAPVDFKNGKAYAMSTGEILTPSEMKAQTLAIMSKLRNSKPLTTINRAYEDTILGVIDAVVVAGKVMSDKQESLMYLTTKFNSDPAASLTDWAQKLAATIAEKNS